MIARVLPAALLMVSVTACGPRGAAPVRPTPTPTLRPTSTVTVGFAVISSPVPTPRARPRPRPTSTPFVAPAGPYLVLVPNSGPPISRTIVVRGGGLPPATMIDLEWTASGRAAGVGTAVGTSKVGRFTTTFRIPGAPPGSYEVIAQVGSVPYVAARYQVLSRASLSAAVSGPPGRQTIRIRGRGFVGRLHVVLIAYPLAKGKPPRVVARADTTPSGRLDVGRSGQDFQAGEYILRAWSESALSSQMAETYFEVVL